MKVKVALLALVAMLALSTTAEAYFYVSFGKARKASKVWVREACEQRGPSCVWWKVGHCRRFTAQRVDCLSAIAFRGEACTFILENRVGKYGNGYLIQRRRSLRCERV